MVILSTAILVHIFSVNIVSVRMYVYACILHIILHINILPGDTSVGMGPIDDDVAI